MRKRRKEKKEKMGTKRGMRTWNAGSPTLGKAMAVWSSPEAAVQMRSAGPHTKPASGTTGRNQGNQR